MRTAHLIVAVTAFAAMLVACVTYRILEHGRSPEPLAAGWYLLACIPAFISLWAAVLGRTATRTVQRIQLICAAATLISSALVAYVVMSYAFVGKQAFWACIMSAGFLWQLSIPFALVSLWCLFIQIDRRLHQP